MVKRYPTSTSSEDPAQRTTYIYDSYSSGQNQWGRLAGIEYGHGLKERFSYTVGGLMADHRLYWPGDADLWVRYAWDNEGKLTWMEYPRAARRDASGNYVTPTWGRHVSYSYDAAGRLVGASDPDTGQAWVQQAQYNAAGQATGYVVTAPSAWETWSFQYNVRGQMTREKAVSQTLYATVLDMEYRYSATANDGRIVQQKDWVSGEEVSYQYDELGRLIAAATTGPQWGLSWTYDGFGNRLAQNVTKGTAPVVSLSINAATNRITTGGFAYDAAGNLVQWPGGTEYWTEHEFDPRRRTVRQALSGYASKSSGTKGGACVSRGRSAADSADGGAGWIEEGLERFCPGRYAVS